MAEKGAYWVTDGTSSEQAVQEPEQPPPDCSDLQRTWNKARNRVSQLEHPLGDTPRQELEAAQASADRTAGSDRAGPEEKARVEANLRAAQQAADAYETELMEAKAAEAAARQALEGCEQAAAGGG
jgi:hypothetical protein